MSGFFVLFWSYYFFQSSEMANRGFASDNNSGVHPRVMDAIVAANTGHATGYGTDSVTAMAVETVKSQFKRDCDVYFVYNGTGANVLAIQTLVRPFQSVLCASTAHINVDECGAPEKHAGCKVIAIPTSNGKLTPELVEPHLTGFGFEHHSQPAMISITQCTELGTVYTISEIRSLSELAHRHNMYLHMDGARIANAAACLEKSIDEITLGAGVDVLSLGGTKNGLMFGEAVVFSDSCKSDITKYIRKQTTQLHSKMRFIAAQFNELFKDGLWLENARHSNEMAGMLAHEISEIPQIKITQKVESNGVFAIVPERIKEPLRSKFFFYDWDQSINEVRWMTSFDTRPDDIKLFVEEIKRLLQ
jgi:threonine aldolase